MRIIIKNNHINRKEMKKITIGRNPANDIIINNPNVSSNHAVIVVDDSGDFILRDLNSTNGTFLNGKRITEAKINSTDKVQVCDSVINWKDYLTEQASPKPQPIQNPNYITIGRNSSNLIVIPQSDVSSFHATISKSASGKIFIQDNNSSNGTFVNGRKITQHNLMSGDRVLLANKYPLEWENLYKKDIGTKLGNSKTNVWTPLIGLIAVIVIGIYFFKPLSDIVNEKVVPMTVECFEHQLDI